MDLEAVKKKIKLAKEIVKDEDPSIKTTAFQVVLLKLLESDIKIGTSVNSSKQTNETKSKQISSDLDTGKERLAGECNISVAQLNDVLDFENDLINVTVSLRTTNPHKQAIATACILTAYDIVYDKTRVQSSVLAKCLRLSKISSSHMAGNLKKYDDEQSFRVVGVKRSAKYKITEHGKKYAFETIKRLAEDGGYKMEVSSTNNGGKKTRRRNRITKKD